MKRLLDILRAPVEYVRRVKTYREAYREAGGWLCENGWHELEWVHLNRRGYPRRGKRCARCGRSRGQIRREKLMQRRKVPSNRDAVVPRLTGQVI